MRESKTLYLDGNEPLQVRLDGPALVVSGDGRRVGRFPLRRFSRVLVSGAVEWSMAALRACLERSIAVVFLDREGALLGLCIGKGLPVLDRRGILDEFATRPDWPEHYATWRAAMERRMILKLVRDVPLQVPDLRPQTVAQAARACLLALGDENRVWRMVGFFEGAASAAAAEILMEEGIAPLLLVHERHDFCLGRDLARLMAWDARLTAIRFLKRVDQEEPVRLSAVKAAETRMPRWRHLARECLDCLERIAMGLKYGCH